MFRKLMTLDDAKQVINVNFKPTPVGDEDVALLEAYNRVLKEDVVSTLDIPPFNRSTMDGYAVRAEDTFCARETKPVTLEISGAISIGEQPNIVVGEGEAVEIVTGAVLPKGADAVVMVEDTERVNNHLQVYETATPNMNVLKKGSDIKMGETVLHAGQVLGAPEIGVLAALGLTKARAFKPPMVAVLSTGGEFAESGKPLPPGKIFDINTYSLSTAVIESGGKPVCFGVVPDDKAALSRTLATALASADVVVTSGGVSVGPRDVMPQIIDSLGKPGLVVYGLAVKPGKPTSIAFAQGKPIFSLPGNPSAALMIFYLLVRPVIQRLCGRTPSEVRSIRAFASAKIFSAKGRRTFVNVRLALDSETCRLIAEPVEPAASGAIATLVEADGFIEVPENQQFIDKDGEVLVKLFRNA